MWLRQLATSRAVGGTRLEEGVLVGAEGSISAWAALSAGAAPNPDSRAAALLSTSPVNFLRAPCLRLQLLTFPSVP